MHCVLWWLSSTVYSKCEKGFGYLTYEYQNEIECCRNRAPIFQLEILKEKHLNHFFSLVLQFPSSQGACRASGWMDWQEATQGLPWHTRRTRHSLAPPTWWWVPIRHLRRTATILHHPTNKYLKTATRSDVCKDSRMKRNKGMWHWGWIIRMFRHTGTRASGQRFLM